MASMGLFSNQLAGAKSLHVTSSFPAELHPSRSHLSRIKLYTQLPLVKSPLHNKPVAANPFISRACAMSADTPPSPSAQPATSPKPIAAPSPPESSPTSSSFYTEMKDKQSEFWDSYQGLETVVDPCKGWTNQETGVEDAMLLAELLLIANMAADRAEMHSNLAQQRDNWNKLFQSTLTIVTMTATILAAMDGHGRSLSLSLPACLMDALAGAMMVGINKFQPSQLAEEQRSANRLLKRLGNDIQYTLQVSPELRQDAQTYLDDARSRLLALDKAYPLPLTPVVLEKFPQQIVPPALRQQPDTSKPEIHASAVDNGWEGQVSKNLISLCGLMQDSDQKMYIQWARRMTNINKCCAVGAPLFAISGAILNAADAFGSTNLGVLAAVSSTLAAFAGSFSHDAQLGMIFELYRNSAGYYAEMQASIERAVRLPVEKRENGKLFSQRVAYELGRRPEELPMVPANEKTAGVLF